MLEMTNAQVPPTYKMTIDLNVIDHLGLNLYSNISAVLTEAVANAWDADAHNVEIVIDVQDGHDTVKIVDDGIGMTISDMNAKYLHVGYRKRTCEDDKTALGRPVMGRKGLGKLSLFSIADVVEVQSAKDGQRHGLVMDAEEIRIICRDSAQEYNPKPLSPEDIIIEKGTTIILHKIKRPRLVHSLDALRMLLARRFSVIGEAWGFEVTLNGNPITINDRCELGSAQFLWTIGDTHIDEPANASIKERFSIPSDGTEMGPRGWIATVNKPTDLVANGVNLNGIVVLARGRLMQEDILPRFLDGRLYTKYITGQINYDLLDDTLAGDDVATSDRQRIKEDDPRYQYLEVFLKTALSQVEAQWKASRPKQEIMKAMDQYPVLANWIKELRPGVRKTAERMISEIVSIPVDSQEDTKTLIKHSVLAFERMELRGNEGELAGNISNVPRLLELLADRDSVEAALYHEIVKSRLEVIQKLTGLVDDDAKEKVLQEYLFKHLWLLDTTWERASDGLARIEESLGREFEKAGEILGPDEKKGRLDIRYKTSMGVHVIVELKRAARVVPLYELLEQGQKYKTALKKCLNDCGERNANIQIVFVLGRPVPEAAKIELGGQEYVDKQLQNLTARIVYYDQMITSAQKQYSEYLEKNKQLDRLDEVMANL